MKRYSLKFQYTFEKDAKRLGKRYPSMKSDVASLCEDILANPNLGADLGGGLRKIRMAITSKGHGKNIYRDSLRGGGRDKSADHLRQV